MPVSFCFYVCAIIGTIPLYNWKLPNFRSTPQHFQTFLAFAVSTFALTNGAKKTSATHCWDQETPAGHVSHQPIHSFDYRIICQIWCQIARHLKATSGLERQKPAEQEMSLQMSSLTSLMDLLNDTAAINIDAARRFVTPKIPRPANEMLSSSLDANY